MKKLSYHLTDMPEPPHSTQLPKIKIGVRMDSALSAVNNTNHVLTIKKVTPCDLVRTKGLTSSYLSGLSNTRLFVWYASKLYPAIKVPPSIWSWVSHFCIWGSKGLLAHPARTVIAITKAISFFIKRLLFIRCLGFRVKLLSFSSLRNFSKILLIKNK